LKQGADARFVYALPVIAGQKLERTDSIFTTVPEVHARTIPQQGAHRHHRFGSENCGSHPDWRVAAPRSPLS
jgi:hypothetical protein